MEMRNKLRKRVDWYSGVKNDPDLFQEYLTWLKGHKYIYKFKSNSRRAYYFLLNTKGRKYIKDIRDGVQRFYSEIDIKRALGAKWIKEVDE